MNIRIEPIQVSNQDDFFSLFEDNSFDHQKQWKTCFCRFYHSTCSFDEWIKRTGEDNKEEAKRSIAEGKMSGYLAFDGMKCIGWINVGPVHLYHRLLPYLEDQFKNNKTALVICFVIRDDYRGMKVASGLLDHAISKLKEKGYQELIALPRDADLQEKNYRGPKSMYLNRGFVLYHPDEETLYMIKTL